MNRVYCLYRVSTNQQLHEDDIPMQRQACQEFADTHGWIIIKELYEKGISGFKTPTMDRWVLQQIKKDAELKKFDANRERGCLGKIIKQKVAKDERPSKKCREINDFISVY